MEKTLSNKIKILQFIMICLVVLLHSYNIKTKEMIVPLYIEFIEKIFSDGICRVAVPMLGLISGFLYFYKPFKYKDKLTSRLYSLIIPYLIYNSLIILFVIISNFNFNNILELTSKYTYHLWYLKDLYIIVIISPIIYFLLNKSKTTLSIIALYLILFEESIYFPTLLGYFIIGALGSELYKNSEKIKYSLSSVVINRRAFFILLVIWLYLVYIYTISGNHIFRNLSIISGILFNLEIIKVFINNRYILDISKYSFFIYLFHEPLSALIKRVIITICTKQASFLLIYYFINPIIVVILLATIAKITSYILPKIYNVITGSRGKVVIVNEY